MFKKVKIYILSLIIFITLTACQTVTDKIDEKTELEKKELSKWLNKTEEDLKSFYGQPDKVEFLKTRNRNYVYFTEKYKIKCERKFEVNLKNDQNIQLLKCKTEAAGHGGMSGRDNAIEELAEEFSFILKNAKIKN